MKIFYGILGTLTISVIVFVILAALSDGLAKDIGFMIDPDHYQEQLK